MLYVKSVAEGDYDAPEGYEQTVITCSATEISTTTAILTLSKDKKFSESLAKLNDDKGNVWNMSYNKANPGNYDNQTYKGQQFGTSKTNGTVTFTATIEGKTIKSVSVTAAAGADTPTVKITVNGESWGTESLNKKSTTYTKTGNASGEISITLDQNSAKKAVYLGAISVIYQ